MSDPPCFRATLLFLALCAQWRTFFRVELFLGYRCVLHTECEDACNDANHLQYMGFGLSESTLTERLSVECMSQRAHHHPLNHQRLPSRGQCGGPFTPGVK